MTTESNSEKNELTPAPKRYENILRRAEISDALNLRELLKNSSGLDFNVDGDGWIHISQKDPGEVHDLVVDDYDHLTMELGEMCAQAEEDINIMSPPLFAYGVMNIEDPFEEIGLYSDHKKEIVRGICEMQINDGVLVSPREHPVSKGIDARKIGYLVSKYPSFDFWVYQSIQLIDTLKEADPNDPETIMLARYALHYYTPIMRFFEIPYLIFLLEQNAFRIIDEGNYERYFQLSRDLNGLPDLGSGDREAYEDDYEVEWNHVEAVKEKVTNDFLSANPELNDDDIQIHARLKPSLTLAHKCLMGRSRFDNIGIIIEVSEEAIGRSIGVDPDLITKYVGNEREVGGLIIHGGVPQANVLTLEEQHKISKEVGDYLMKTISNLMATNEYTIPPNAQGIQNTFPVENRPSYNNRYTAINTNLTVEGIEGVVEVRWMHFGGFEFHILDHPVYKHIHRSVERKGVDEANIREQLSSLQHLKDVALGRDKPLYELARGPQDGFKSWVVKRYTANRALFQEDSFYLCSTHGSNTVLVSSGYGLNKLADTVNPNFFVTSNMRPNRKGFSKSFLVGRVVRDPNGSYLRRYAVYDESGYASRENSSDVHEDGDQYQFTNFDQVTILHPVDRSEQHELKPVITVNKILNMEEPMQYLKEEFPDLNERSLQRMSMLIDRLRRLTNLRLENLDQENITTIYLDADRYKVLTEGTLIQFKILLNQARIHKRFLELLSIFREVLDDFDIGIRGYYTIALSKLDRFQLSSLDQIISSDEDLGIRFYSLLFYVSNRHNTDYLEAVFTILSSTDPNTLIYQTARENIIDSLVVMDRDEDIDMFDRIFSNQKLDDPNEVSMQKIIHKLGIKESDLKKRRGDLKK